MEYVKRHIVILIALSLSISASAKRLLITDFGVGKNSKQNVLPTVREALKSFPVGEENVLVFPKGSYHFFIDSDAKQEIGIVIKNLNNLTIEGDGSEFIFHGYMSIAKIHESENIKLQNFSVDWERPFISQGQIIALNNNCIDIKIDKKQYPYVIENERILFLGEDWKKGVEWHNLYDKEKQEIVYQTLDMPLGENLFKDYKTEEVSEGLIRIHHSPNYKPELGTYITMWHGRYIKNGIGISESKNISLENINIYHALSNGILGFRSENISMKNMNMTANSQKGRVFSLIADASHFNTCKGLIEVDNCTHTGQGDDFINVHGMNIVVQKCIDNFSIEIPPSGKASSRNTIKEGDEMWIVGKTTMQRGKSRTIETITEKYENNKLIGYHIRFSEKLPSGISEGDVLENKSWVPDVHIQNCNILKKHRARGILVSTPGKVIIENNYFRTAGAAILIEGDNNYWFESGACDDAVIRNNTFDDCLTSKWGDGVIAITPSHHPRNEKENTYHKNIKIYNNTFRSFDHVLLYARSVGNLQFMDNNVVRTYGYSPFYGVEGFYLDGCKDVFINNNKYSSDFEGKIVKIKHMKKSDVTIKDKVINIIIE
ncbi:right-handed parallel beta-helix repeat-containing protein [Dysgonomonas reticulitermitis]